MSAARVASALLCCFLAVFIAVIGDKWSVPVSLLLLGIGWYVVACHEDRTEDDGLGQESAEDGEKEEPEAE